MHGPDVFPSLVDRHTRRSPSTLLGWYYYPCGTCGHPRDRHKARDGGCLDCVRCTGWTPRRSTDAT